MESKGPDDTFRMHRMTWICTVFTCLKGIIRLMRPISESVFFSWPQLVKKGSWWKLENEWLRSACSSNMTYHCRMLYSGHLSCKQKAKALVRLHTCPGRYRASVSVFTPEFSVSHRDFILIYLSFPYLKYLLNRPWKQRTNTRTQLGVSVHWDSSYSSNVGCRAKYPPPHAHPATPTPTYTQHRLQRNSIFQDIRMASMSPRK